MECKVCVKLMQNTECLKTYVKGAAYVTVIGQIAAALVVMKKGFRRPPRLSYFAPYTGLCL